MTTTPPLPGYAHRLTRVAERLQREFPSQPTARIREQVDAARDDVSQARGFDDYAEFADTVLANARHRLREVAGQR